MILLASTSDLVRVTTSSAATTDVHASYVDEDGGSFSADTQNTGISSATTTTVVSSPGSGVLRAVKAMSVRNRHASTSVDVTVLHTDGTTTVEILKATLAAGAELYYEEGEGFSVRDSFGRALDRLDGIVSPVTHPWSTVVLSGDVSNAEAVPNTITNVTGLSFSVVSGRTYWFRFSIWYTSAANATGSLWAINGPTTSLLALRSEYVITSTTRTINEGVVAYDTPATSNSGSVSTGSNAIIEGFITPSADGTVIARFASEVTVSAVTAKAGSLCHYQQVLP